jgi:hypothetical protein
MWSILIGALALGPASPAQSIAFDPRQHKTEIAGAPSAVLVLATPHLSGMPASVRPEDLEPLLDRLAEFKPEVITVEALSGQDCAMLQDHPALFGTAYDDYCLGTAEAQRATGLAVPAALAAIKKTMSNWTASPTPGDRRRLASLFLAANDRASAQVQWLRLAPEERRAGDGLDADLVKILERKGGKLNENYTIAARLAARLGLDRVYSVDDHSADAIVADAGEGFGAALSKLRQSEAAKANRADFESRIKALSDPESVLDYYRHINSPAHQRAVVASDFGAAGRQETPQLYGRHYLAWWETRNLRMVANIRAAFGTRPGARVLTIVGASHKPYFEAYLDMMQDVDLVDIEEVLSGNWKR